jgi:F0F1-type ATP synthase membrane subunit b/b'
MSEDVGFPTRFRGYDRAVVDQTLFELRSALDYAQAERDRAVAHALTVETGTSGDTASATVQWLLDTAEQDAQRIRDEAHAEAAGYTERADELLRHRIELIEQAQHEADVCRAQAAEEARLIVHDALEKANALLRDLRESEAAMQEMFASGAMTHRMPPPRRSLDEPQPMPAQVDSPHGSASPTVSVPYPARHSATPPGNVPQQGNVLQGNLPPQGAVPPGNVPPQGNVPQSYLAPEPVEPSVGP